MVRKNCRCYYLVFISQNYPKVLGFTSGCQHCLWFLSSLLWLVWKKKKMGISNIRKVNSKYVYTSIYILLPHKPVFKNSKTPLSINNQQKLSVLISVPQFTQSETLVCQTLPYILCYLLVQKKSRGIASCTPNMHRCTSICLIIFLSSSIGDTNFWLFSMNSQWVFMLKWIYHKFQKDKK